MKPALTIAYNSIISPLLALALAAFTAADQNTKVVFVRGAALFTSGVDGASARQIFTVEGQRLVSPQWSPDGTQIEVILPGQSSVNPKTHGVITILNFDGSIVSRIPVFSTEADGTMVGGMRFIEHAGWFGKSSVFATGSANPYVSEYRVFDIYSGKLLSDYFGNSFASCARSSRLAYVSRPEEKVVPELIIDGKRVYSLDDSVEIEYLLWSIDCTRLAVLQESKGKFNLKVLKGFEVEANVHLADSGSIPIIVATTDAFLINLDQKGSIYSPTSHSLTEGDELIRVSKELELRREVSERLGAKQADWWSGSN